MSSGSSAGTFAVSAGTHIDYHAEEGTKNETDMFLVPVQKKSLQIGGFTFRTYDLDGFFFKGFRSTLVNR